MSKVSELIVNAFVTDLKIKVLPSGSVAVDSNSATSNMNRLYLYCEPVLEKLARVHSKELMPIFTTKSRREALKSKILDQEL
jgi:hypothetical protein